MIRHVPNTGLPAATTKRRRITVSLALLLLTMAGCRKSGGEKVNTAALPQPDDVRVIDLVREGNYQPLLKGQKDSFGMRSGLVMLKEGQSCGQHSTEAHEELLIILQGSGTALIGPQGEKTVPVKANQVVYIPPHTVHNIENTGSGPLHYIYVVAPAAKLR